MPPRCACHERGIIQQPARSFNPSEVAPSIRLLRSALYILVFLFVIGVTLRSQSEHSAHSGTGRLCDFCFCHLLHGEVVLPGANWHEVSGRRAEVKQGPDFSRSNITQPAPHDGLSRGTRRARHALSARFRRYHEAAARVWAVWVVWVVWVRVPLR